MKYRAFVTGSHAYGLPGHDSDIDVVVLVTMADLEKLLKASDDLDIATDPEYARNCHTTSLRFGSLNLLATTDEKAYQCWWDATRKLKEQSPVSREYAVRFMHKARIEHGLIKQRPIDDDDIPF